MAEHPELPEGRDPLPRRSRLLGLFNGAHPLRRVIEHVYLTYDGGTPMVHLSRNFVPDRDPDLIASMFTAIENFMDESFHEMGIGSVRSIELGDRHQVAFGRGKWLLLYVVYRGRESNQLERHVIHQVGELEHRFSKLLSDWDGDMDQAEVLRRYLIDAWFFDRDLSTVALQPTPAGAASDAGQAPVAPRYP